MCRSLANTYYVPVLDWPRPPGALPPRGAYPSVSPTVRAWQQQADVSHERARCPQGYTSEPNING